MTISPERHEGVFDRTDLAEHLANRFLQMESAVTAPVSGHIKRVVVHEGKSVDIARKSSTENLEQVTRLIKET